MTIATPGERHEHAGELHRGEDVRPGDDREERDEDRRRRDEQRRVAGGHRRQARRPEDLVDAEAKAAENPHGDEIAPRQPDAPLPPAQEDEQRHRREEEPQEREADRWQDRKGRLHDDEVPGPDDHDGEDADLGEAAVGGRDADAPAATAPSASLATGVVRGATAAARSSRAGGRSLAI